MHYVIIGNGGAGISALQAIRGIDRTSDITMISREKHPAYSPCSLPNLLASELDDDGIIRFDDDFHSRHNAELINNAEAVNIHPDKNTIELADGSSVKWDRLLIAAGASPIVPKGLAGLDLDGVYVMGSLDSTLAIRDHADRGARKAVVVGGGFIGIETAVMLGKRGMDVVVVEMLPRILSRMLDPDVSEHVEALMKDHGIDLRTDSTFNGAFGSSCVEQVKIDNEMLACDMVVIAIGVRPNIHLVEGSGVIVKGGIEVDSSMMTNRPGIYAAGDIARVREQVGGLSGSYMTWPNAIEQGRIAGLNMAGQDVKYNGAELINSLDVFEVPVLTMGYNSGMAGAGTEVLKWSDGREIKKALVKDDILIGLQFMGTIRNAGTLYALMKEGAFIGNIKDRLLDDNLVISPDHMPEFRRQFTG